MRLAPTPFRAFHLRLAVVALLCVSTPSVQDLVVDVSSWLGDGDCCGDDCERTGEPCTQQCLHCVCGVRAIAAPLATAPLVLAVSTPRTAATPEAMTAELGGHLDPPFRPPVS